jgi:hypothetical protein
MDLWLYAHGNFCMKVQGIEKLMSKHASRYLLKYFQSWRGLVEYYFHREILLQQNAIRRAYALASRFLNQSALISSSIDMLFGFNLIRTAAPDIIGIPCHAHTIKMAGCFGGGRALKMAFS